MASTPSDSHVWEESKLLSVNKADAMCEIWQLDQILGNMRLLCWAQTRHAAPLPVHGTTPSCMVVWAGCQWGGAKWHGYRRFGGMRSPSVNSAPLAVAPMEWPGCPKIWPVGTLALRCLRAWRQLRAPRARFQGALGLV